MCLPKLSFLKCPNKVKEAQVVVELYRIRRITDTLEKFVLAPQSHSSSFRNLK